MNKPLALSSSKLAFASLVTLLFCLSMCPVQAATGTWTGGGGDGKWLTPANWASGTPSPGDSLVFQTANRVNNTNNFGAGTSFGSITINGPGGFNLFGNQISLGGNI